MTAPSGAAKHNAQRDSAKPHSGLHRINGESAGASKGTDGTGSVRAGTVERIKGRGAFKLVPAADLEIKPPSWLISGLLEADSLAQVFGEPGSYKSFLALDWACCIATGTPFDGRPVQQAPVIYIAGEGHNGLARRLKAWSVANGVDLEEAALYVSERAAALCDDDDAREVVDRVNEVAQGHGISPGLVVIDTVARNFGPGDENSNTDMSQFVQVADSIRNGHKATVLLVHHTGHQEKSRARGATALKAALDAEYRIDRDKSEVVRLESTKMKDASEPKPLAFKAATVEIGCTDPEGSPITSVVLKRTEYTAPPKGGQSGRGKWQKQALTLLDDLFDEARRERRDSGKDPEAARVSVEQWRRKMADNRIPQNRNPEVRRTLENNGDVVVHDGFVWPT